MAIVKARLDALLNPIPPIATVKSIQRGSTSLSVGSATNINISPVNPAKSVIQLTFRNNTANYTHSENTAGTAVYSGTADFIVQDGQSNAFSINTSDRLVARRYYSSEYRQDYFECTLLVRWEVIEYV